MDISIEDRGRLYGAIFELRKAAFRSGLAGGLGIDDSEHRAEEKVAMNAIDALLWPQATPTTSAGE